MFFFTWIYFIWMNCLCMYMSRRVIFTSLFSNGIFILHCLLSETVKSKSRLKNTCFEKQFCSKVTLQLLHFSPLNSYHNNLVPRWRRCFTCVIYCSICCRIRRLRRCCGGGRRPPSSHDVRPILLVSSLRSTHVPVGEDQIQHLELAQDLARIFNGRFGELFPEPSALLSKIRGRSCVSRYLYYREMIQHFFFDRGNAEMLLGE